MRRFRVAKYHPQALADELRLQLRSRQDYEVYWDQPGLTDVQRAARYLFILKNSFANKVDHRSFGYGVSQSRGTAGSWTQVMVLIERLHAVLQPVTIEHLDFEDIFRRYDRPETFFYCDPPYYMTSQPFRCRFKAGDHERLANAVRGLKGKVLVTLNDLPDVWDFYEGWIIEPVQAKYSICAHGKIHVARELLIRNYRLPGEKGKGTAKTAVRKRRPGRAARAKVS